MQSQYTPLTPTQLSSWVASAVCTQHNSQLVSDTTTLNKFAKSKVELRRVGGVNAPVGSRDPVYNFLCCWATEVGDKWRHNDAVVEKVINIDQRSRSETAMESVWSVSKLSTETVGSRREGLGPDRYMTISVHTTSVHVFRQIRNLDHFGTCTTSVRVSRVPRRYIPLRYIVLTTSVQPLRYNATSVHRTLHASYVAR